MSKVFAITLSLCLLVLPVTAEAAAVLLPVTGQTSCFDSTGGGISCAGTGQDGDLRKGASWPSPRFTDNGNGTITDNLTGLIWLSNAGCTGLQSWDAAIAFSQALASGRCALSDGSVPGDWRLPNVNELESLVDLSAVFPAMPPGRLFTNLEPSAYWSSTTHAHYTANAWTVNLSDGSLGGDVKSLQYRVLPVRGGL